MKPITIMLCVNNPDNGMPCGRLSAVHLDSEIELSCGIIDGEPMFRHYSARSQIKVSHRRFAIRSYGTWVGNWCWDAVNMKHEVAIDFLCFLHKLHYREHPKFSVDCAPVEFFDRWRDSRPIEVLEMSELLVHKGILAKLDGGKVGA